MGRLDKKHKLMGNLEKILKSFDENSIEKQNFYLLWGKVVATNNRAFGNTILFLKQFFSGSGGGG